MNDVPISEFRKAILANHGAADARLMARHRVHETFQGEYLTRVQARGFDLKLCQRFLRIFDPGQAEALSRLEVFDCFGGQIESKLYLTRIRGWA